MTPPAAAVALLERLVAFDTVSARPNLALIEFVQDYLARHAVASRLVPDPSGTKANLFATIGPDAAGGVALAGHTDVVPVEGQPWSGDPFTLACRGDRLYGRGTADMKGFIAVVLAAVPALAARRLRTPIHLCLSYDEELGCLGMPHLLRLLGRELPKPALAIVGEPTAMRVVNAHKGVRAQYTTVIGQDWHSSAPHRGRNAILVMGRFLGFLERLAQDLAARGDRGAVPGLDLDPPWTTLSVGTIEGGTALNIVARECRLGWEFRPLPGVDADAILRSVEEFAEREMQPLLAQAGPGARVATVSACTIPALRPEANGRAENLALSLTGTNRAGSVNFGSEAGQFQEAGISAVLCGPGSIEDAHRADEFVTLEQLSRCADFVQRLADWAAA